MGFSVKIFRYLWICRSLICFRYLYFLGCCGAIKGFRFLHVLYAFIIGAIIVAEIAIIIAFIAYQNKFRTELVSKLQQSITKYYVGPPINNSTANSVSVSWDFIQFNLDCCGAVGASDFLHADNWNPTDPYNPSQNLTVPFTCCPINAAKSWTSLPTDFSSAENCAVTGNNSSAVGCYDRLVDILVSYKKKAIIGAVVVGVIEILAFIFAISLYCRKEDYTSL